MWELYLISRIGALHGILCAATVISVMVSIICFCASQTTDDWNGEKVWEKSEAKLKHTSKNFAIVALFSLLGVIITPTQEQAYLIYGVGGTIDCLKSNDKVKQLPDKVIYALDKWLDKQIEDKK